MDEARVARVIEEATVARDFLALLAKSVEGTQGERELLIDRAFAHWAALDIALGDDHPGLSAF